MPRVHHRLAAYERATCLADELHGLVHAWHPLDQWSVGIQLLRAADSVGANIAEGAGRRSTKERRRFFLIARGSLFETEHWLERAHRRGLIDSNYESTIAQIARPLAGLINRPAPT